MEALVFESRDLAETEEFLSSAYAKMRISGDVARPRARVTRETAASLSVDELQLEYTLGYDVDPLGKVCLCTVETGSILNHTAGYDEELLLPGDAVLFAPADRPLAGEVRRSRYIITMFDPALLAQVASAEPAHRAGPISLLGSRPVSVPAQEHLKKTIAYVRDNVLADPVMAEQPLVVSAAEQLLAASVLTTFPSNVHPSTTDRHERDAHPDALRRAIVFIDDHADTPITTADIATATRVSIRALQSAFRTHMGTTPLGYLRQVRMAAAHADLQEASPADTTVTTIAARWGFFHPGRFARQYKSSYGRPPSDTLNT